MSATRYDVVFHGEILDGFDVATVKQNFIKLFGLSDAKVEQVFTSKRVTLKPNVEEAVARKFEKALTDAGAVIVLEAKQPDTGTLALEPTEEELNAEAEAAAAPASEAAPETDGTAAAAADGGGTWHNQVVRREDISPKQDDAAEAGDIYAAPEAELSQAVDNSEFGSLEKAEAGDFDASLGTVLSEGWAKVSGNKGTLWAGLGLYLLTAFVLGYVLELIFGDPAANMQTAAANGQVAGAVASVLFSQLLQAIILLPVGVGLSLLSARIAADIPEVATSIFSHFNKLLPLVLTYVLMLILIGIGFALFILPGIYLSVAYSLALLLVVDKGLGPWQALEASRKAVTKCWFSVFGLWIVTSLIAMVAMIPLGIGLIWALPLFLLAFGVLYRNIFGVSAVDAE